MGTTQNDGHTRHPQTEPQQQRKCLKKHPQKKKRGISFALSLRIKNMKKKRKKKKEFIKRWIRSGSTISVKKWPSVAG